MVLYCVVTYYILAVVSYYLAYETKGIAFKGSNKQETLIVRTKFTSEKNQYKVTFQKITNGKKAEFHAETEIGLFFSKSGVLQANEYYQKVQDWLKMTKKE